jgi:hypothetical protein
MDSHLRIEMNHEQRKNQLVVFFLKLDRKRNEFDFSAEMRNVKGSFPTAKIKIFRTSNQNSRNEKTEI